jgi:two-component system, sporulation sensor kinase E
LRRRLDEKLVPEEKAMFESIEKSIDYSNKIINDLLDYSSYYSDEVKLDLSQVTPKSIVKAALALSMQPKNITLLDDTEDWPRFYVDEVKLCRSFINILKNAFDAMPNGGEVHISSIAEAEKVTFTFKDNGCGMTEETMQKLWTPLFTTKAKGMGFGMVICKRNISAHGGKIGLESVLGQGTLVTVELPLGLKP